MKQLLLCVLLACSLHAAAVDVQINDVGLNWYIGTNTVTPLTLRLSNPGGQQTPVTLRIELSEPTFVIDGMPTERKPPHSVFTVSAVAPANGFRDITVPILMTRFNDDVHVVALDASGRELSHIDSGKTPAHQSQTLVAMLCVEAKCGSLQSAIGLSGDSSQRETKNRSFNFVTIQPKDEAYAYEPAAILVIAIPVKSLTAVQKTAIENFARSGGRLIFVEDLMADPQFMAEYRVNPAGTAQPIGRGLAFHVASDDDPALASIFTKQLESVQRRAYIWPTFFGDNISWLIASASPRVVFPKLRWILTWLITYLVLVGFVNWVVLRRLKRLEFGWITVTAIALVFAIGLYAWGASRGPRSFLGANCALYWMDSHSGTAFLQDSVRIIAPERRDVAIAATGSLLLAPSEVSQNFQVGRMGLELEERPMGPTLRVQLGDPQQVDASLLRYSYGNANYQGSVRLAGSVHLSAPLTLKNNTGMDFSSGVVVDRIAHEYRVIPALAKNASFDFSKQEPRAWDQQAQQKASEAESRYLITPENFPFHIPCPAQRCFIGHTTAVASIDVKNAAVQWRKEAIVVVSLDDREGVRREQGVINLD